MRGSWLNVRPRIPRPLFRGEAVAAMRSYPGAGREGSVRLGPAGRHREVPRTKPNRPAHSWRRTPSGSAGWQLTNAARQAGPPASQIGRPGTERKAWRHAHRRHDVAAQVVRAAAIGEHAI